MGRPKKKFARVRIEWHEGAEYCADCAFSELQGFESPCRQCLGTYIDGLPFHPVIVPIKNVLEDDL